jgi:pilus assembly protein CpaC
MLRYTFLIFLLSAFPTLSWSQDEPKERDLNVAIGIDEVVQLDYRFSPKIKLGQKGIVTLEVSPRRKEITFKGIKPGKTSVTIRDASTDERRDVFLVNVTSDGMSKQVQNLRELIGSVEGLDIGIKGGKVYVEGELVVPDDIGRVSTVLEGFPDVLRLIEISPHTQRVIARKIQDELARNNMKDVTVRVVNKVFWLEGVVNSKAKAENATKIAEAFVPDKWNSLKQGSGRVQEAQRAAILNFISVNEKKDPPPPAKQVKISAQFVELAKDYKKAFGFKWAPIMSNSGSISFGKTEQGNVVSEESGTLSGTISQLFPKLATAKEAGYARVIQSGMIITKSDVQANIVKNKNIPYQIGSGEFQRADNAELKFDLRVTPKVGDQEKIELNQLTINVSLPAGTTGGGQPVTTSNSITTNLVVKNKESAVIGGVVQNSATTGYDKNDPSPTTLPEDGSASVLFNFIRSKGYVAEKSQFVIFVTPEIIESASASTEAIRKKFRKRSR